MFLSLFEFTGTNTLFLSSSLQFDSKRLGKITSTVAPGPWTSPRLRLLLRPRLTGAFPEIPRLRKLRSPAHDDSSPSTVAPSSQTPVPASAHGVSSGPLAANTDEALAESASEAPVVEVASGAVDPSSTPAEPSAGGASADRAVLQSQSSPRLRSPSPDISPGATSGSSRFCRTRARHCRPFRSLHPRFRCSRHTGMSWKGSSRRLRVPAVVQILAVV
ncbi:hypothetical protein PF003_g18010 [Phytophthora fragariae]|nr:hypothetical protein PF003_g18010 [Phytophthora fragariae]